MQLNACILVFLFLNIVDIETKSLTNEKYDGFTLNRYRRYLGLGKQFKLNKRYQECVAPGDLPGHCKHQIYCPIGGPKLPLEFLCIIEETHVGICCPDDIESSKVEGSRIVLNLPASGLDYDAADTKTGCGLRTMAKPEDSKKQAQRWPWIAALYFKDVAYEQFCGGTLITDQHVLTASHCLEGLKASDIRVRLGEYDFTKMNETRSQDFSISEIVMHEDYSTLTYENDIAIVKLNKPTIFNSYMWPVCLPPINDKFEGKTAVVAGWGQIRYGGYTSELLLEATIPIWYQKECVAVFAQRITESVICAAAYQGGVDACKGDSGGPLLHKLDNGRWVLIGIVSWGIGCGNKEKPGIYTRVNNYIPWIIKHTTPKYSSA